MNSTKAMVRVETGLAATRATHASEAKASDAGDNLNRFIELVEDCGIDGIAEFLAQACEVQAENIDDEEDEPHANQWLALAPKLRKIAQRATSLYAAARPPRVVIEGTFEEDATDARK
jgi:hypothetical protein